MQTMFVFLWSLMSYTALAISRNGLDSDGNPTDFELVADDCYGHFWLQNENQYKLSSSYSTNDTRYALYYNNDTWQCYDDHNNLTYSECTHSVLFNCVANFSNSFAKGINIQYYIIANQSSGWFLLSELRYNHHIYQRNTNDRYIFYNEQHQKWLISDSIHANGTIYAQCNMSNFFQCSFVNTAHTAITSTDVPTIKLEALHTERLVTEPESDENMMQSTEYIHETSVVLYIKTLISAHITECILVAVTFILLICICCAGRIYCKRKSFRKETELDDIVSSITQDVNAAKLSEEEPHIEMIHVNELQMKKSTSNIRKKRLRDAIVIMSANSLDTIDTKPSMKPNKRGLIQVASYTHDTREMMAESASEANKKSIIQVASYTRDVMGILVEENAEEVMNEDDTVSETPTNVSSSIATQDLIEMAMNTSIVPEEDIINVDNDSMYEEDDDDDDVMNVDKTAQSSEDNLMVCQETARADSMYDAAYNVTKGGSMYDDAADQATKGNVVESIMQNIKIDAT